MEVYRNQMLQKMSIFIDGKRGEFKLGNGISGHTYDEDFNTMTCRLRIDFSNGNNILIEEKRMRGGLNLCVCDKNEKVITPSLFRNVDQSQKCRNSYGQNSFIFEAHEIFDSIRRLEIIAKYPSQQNPIMATAGRKVSIVANSSSTPFTFFSGSDIEHIGRIRTRAGIQTKINEMIQNLSPDNELRYLPKSSKLIEDYLSAEHYNTHKTNGFC